MQGKRTQRCTCPDCGCSVKSSRLEIHRRKARGWRPKAEKELEAQLLGLTPKVAASELGKRVADEARRFTMKHRLNAALYRMSQKHRRRHHRQKKTKAGAWPGGTGMQSGHLIYSGAFEMNRRKH